MFRAWVAPRQREKGEGSTPSLRLEHDPRGGRNLEARQFPLPRRPSWFPFRLSQQHKHSSSGGGSSSSSSSSST